MTIKQLGGVFGRNPTFNDVTIEGQLTFDGDIDINSDLKIDGHLDLSGDIDFGTTGAKIHTVNDDLVAGTGDTALRFHDGDNAIYPVNASSGAKVNGAVTLGDNTARLNDIYMAGDLIVSSGSGIDFSATSGTGTSELFDDYEEGTWTPTFQLYAGTPTNVSGAYTKVGNLVFIHLSATFDGTSDPSTLRIQGVPFQSANSCGLSFAVNTGATCTVEILGGNIEFKDSSGNDLTYSSYGVSAAFELSGVYYVS
jgi:hypothetical protein